MAHPTSMLAFRPGFVVADRRAPTERISFRVGTVCDRSMIIVDLLCATML